MRSNSNSFALGSVAKGLEHLEMEKSIRTLAFAGLLLLSVMAGSLSYLAVREWQRSQRELQTEESLAASAQATEAFKAWSFATDFSVFQMQVRIKKMEPARTFSALQPVFVRLYQRGDSVLMGHDAPSGNAFYRIKFLILYRDGPSGEQLLEILRRKPDAFKDAARGFDDARQAECLVHKLDGPNDWAADTWKFSPAQISDGIQWRRVGDR